MAARKRSHSTKRSSLISPLNPSMHFIVFLVLAFVLVMVVALVMQQTSQDARAKFMCPQSQGDQTAVIQELSRQCPQGVEYTRDANGCAVWVCKTP